MNKIINIENHLFEFEIPENSIILESWILKSKTKNYKGFLKVIPSTKKYLKYDTLQGIPLFSNFLAKKLLDDAIQNPNYDLEVDIFRDYCNYGD